MSTPANELRGQILAMIEEIRREIAVLEGARARLEDTARRGREIKSDNQLMMDATGHLSFITTDEINAIIQRLEATIHALEDYASRL